MYIRAWIFCLCSFDLPTGCCHCSGKWRRIFRFSFYFRTIYKTRKWKTKGTIPSEKIKITV